MAIAVSTFTASRLVGTTGETTTVSWSGSGVSTWQMWRDGAQIASGSGNSGSASVQFGPAPGGWQAGETAGRRFRIELRLSAPGEEVRKYLDLYAVRTDLGIGIVGVVPSTGVLGVTPAVFVRREAFNNSVIYRVLLRKIHSSTGQVMADYDMRIGASGGPIPFGTIESLYPRNYPPPQDPSNFTPLLLVPDGSNWKVIHKVSYDGVNFSESDLGLISTSGYTAQAPSASLSASVQANVAPFQTLLSWTTEGASQVRIRFNGGAWQNVDPNGAFLYTATATTLVELEAVNPHGTTTRSLTLTALTPPSLSTSLSPSSLHGPGTATLAWNASGADSLTLNGQAVPLSGSQQIHITAQSQAGTHVYSFEAVKNSPSGPLVTARQETLTVTWPPPLAIGTPSPLPDAETVRPYSLQLSGSGGYGDPQNYVWTLVSGSLPPGLSLSSSGLISGTPSNAATQTYSFRIRLSDGALEPVEKDFQITSLKINPVSVSVQPIAQLRQLQQAQIPVQAAGGYGTYQWSVSGLPSGLFLAPGSGGAASIQGFLAQTSGQDFTVQITAESSSPDGQVVLSDTSTLFIEYRFYEVSVATASIPDPRADEPYQAEIEAADGIPPYSWNWSAAPGWLQISEQSGRLVLSGTPGWDDEGPLVLTVTVTDSVNGSASRTYSVSVRRSWARMDPFHVIFFRVFDKNGDPVSGYTNDPFPNDPSTPVARAVVGFTVGTDDVEISDVRSRGGGLAPEYHHLREADHFWDTGFLDGRPWPAASMALVLLPAAILEKFDRQKIASIVEASLPMGCLPVIRYYGNPGAGWSENADF